MSEDEGKPEEKSRFVTFWTTLPGVLTGIAAVVAAVVSLVALFHRAPDPGGVAVAPPGPSTVASASDLPLPASSAPTVGSGVDVRGAMTMEIGDFADLSAGTVSGSRTATSQFFLFSGGDGFRLVAAIGQTFATLEGGPDRDACAGALSARQDRELRLTGALRSKTICVLTDTQRVAAVTNTTLPVAGSPRLAFDYVLWD